MYPVVFYDNDTIRLFTISFYTGKQVASLFGRMVSKNLSRTVPNEIGRVLFAIITLLGEPGTELALSSRAC